MSPKPQRINSPEPFSLQKIHPFVDIVPSLLGQVNPPSIKIFKVLSPNFYFKYLFKCLYLSLSSIMVTV